MKNFALWSFPPIYSILKTKLKIKMNTATKEKALQELGELKEKVQKLEKTIQDFDKPKSIMERIDGFRAGYDYLGAEDEEVMLYDKMEEAEMPPHILSEQRCVIVCKALREKQPADRTKTTYTPWFDRTKKPGSGFYASSYTWYLDHAVAVSFRLHLNENAHAIHAGKIMEKDYYTYLMK